MPTDKTHFSAERSHDNVKVSMGKNQNPDFVVANYQTKDFEVKFDQEDSNASFAHDSSKDQHKFFVDNVVHEKKARVDQDRLVFDENEDDIKEESNDNDNFDTMITRVRRTESFSFAPNELSNVNQPLLKKPI